MVGAGQTGVEVVGQIAELAHRVLPGDYREIDTRKDQMVLVEAASAVLGPFDEKLQRYTQAQLERMGVESVAAQRRSRWTTTSSRSETAAARSAFRPGGRYGLPG